GIAEVGGSNPPGSTILKGSASHGRALRVLLTRTVSPEPSAQNPSLRGTRSATKHLHHASHPCLREIAAARCRTPRNRALDGVAPGAYITARRSHCRVRRTPTGRRMDGPRGWTRSLEEIRCRASPS